jgi:hypothetical protein
VYAVPDPASADPLMKDWYAWNETDGTWHQFDAFELDLSNYVQKDDLTEMTEAQFDTLWTAAFGA